MSEKMGGKGWNNVSGCDTITRTNSYFMSGTLTMDFSIIIETLLQQQDSLPNYEDLYQFTTSFYQYWLNLGRLVQQQLMQSEIEKVESQYKFPVSVQGGEENMVI